MGVTYVEVVDDLEDVEDEVRAVAELFEVAEVDVDLLEVEVDDNFGAEEVEEVEEIVDDFLVEVLLDVLEVVVPNDVDFDEEELAFVDEELAIDEVELEEMLLPPPEKTAHVLPRPTVPLNASATLLVEFPLVMSNFVVDT